MANDRKRLWTCDTVRERFRAYILEELDAETHGRMAGHLLECEACAEALFDWVEKAQRLGELPQITPKAPPVPGTSATRLPGTVPVRPKRAPSHGMPAVYHRLARQPDESTSRRLRFSLPEGSRTVSVDADAFVVTLSWVASELTRVEVALQPEYLKANEGRRFVVTDGKNRQLLDQRVQNGRATSDVEVALQSIKSPLAVQIVD